MIKDYSSALDQARDLPEIFELVKQVVRDFTSKERSGLMLGLAKLGGRPGAFVGAFYPVGSNIIVMNKNPLAVVQAFKPQLYNAYCFHILLHEYLHTLGILDEAYNRHVTALISRKAFGKDHPVTVIAKDFTRLFPEIFYASMGWKPEEDLEVEIIDDFDRESFGYIG